MAPKATSQVTPATSQLTVAPTSSAPQFVYEQEIPVNAVAIERAETSLKNWSDHIAAVADADSREDRPSACLSCAHIQEYLPEVLKIDYGLNPSNQSLWLSHPVHALHMSSQGLTDLTKSASAALAAKQNHQPVTYPILYQDEQERSLAMKLPGLPEYWHPAIQPEYCLANARNGALKSKTGAKSGTKRGSPDDPKGKISLETSLNEGKLPLLPSIPSTPVKSAPTVIKPPIVVSQNAKEATPVVEETKSSSTDKEISLINTKKDGAMPEDRIDESGNISPIKASSAPMQIESQSTAPLKSTREEAAGSIDVEMKDVTVETESTNTTADDTKMKDGTQAPSNDISSDDDKQKSDAKIPSSLKEEPKESPSLDANDQTILPTEKPLSKDKSKDGGHQNYEQKGRTASDPQIDVAGNEKTPTPTHTLEEQSRPKAASFQPAPKVQDTSSKIDAETSEDSKDPAKGLSVSSDNTGIKKAAPGNESILGEGSKQDGTRSAMFTTPETASAFAPLEESTSKNDDEPSHEGNPQPALVKSTEKLIKEEEKTKTKPETDATPLDDSGNKACVESGKEGKEQRPSVESKEGSTNREVVKTETSENVPQTVQKANNTIEKKNMTGVEPENSSKGSIVKETLSSQEVKVTSTEKSHVDDPREHQKDLVHKSTIQSIPLPSESTRHASPAALAGCSPASKVKNASAKSVELSTVNAGSVGGSVKKTTEGSKQENPSLLSDATYRHFHAREDNARLVKKSVFGKRPNPSANSAPGKSTSGGTSASTTVSAGGGGSPSSTTSHDKKRRKVDRTASKKVNDLTTFKAPLVKRAVPPTIAIYQKREQDRADRQVGLWMRHFRKSRDLAPQKNEPVSWGPNPLRKGYVFGAIEEKGEDYASSVCQKCPESVTEEVLYCLDCGHVANRSDMRQHMALTRHALAVNLFKLDTSLSCEPRRLYCFHCDDYYHSLIFLQEEERLLLKKTLPWFSWGVNEKSPEIRRSFDPLRFIRLPDVGIFWNGFQATYPIDIPRHHLLAGRASRLRYQLVHGSRGILLKRFDEKFAGHQNSTTRSRGMMALLLDVTREKILKPVGMYNLGNTCFQTSVFQCLVHCLPLQDFFLQKIGHSSSSCQIYRRQKKDRDAVCLASEMDKFFLQYQSQSCGVNITKAMNDLATRAASVSTLSPSMLSDPLLVLRESGGGDGAVVERTEMGEPLVAQKDLLAATWKVKEMSHLAGYDQRDAHEFLHAFLEVLGKHAVNFRKTVAQTLSKKNASNITSPIPNMVEDIFQGILRSVLLCQHCGNKRIQKELFLSISLDLSKEVQRPANSDFAPPGGASSGMDPHSPSRETRKLSVEKCLNHFTTPEELNDPVHCPLCASKTKTKKQHVVSKLPPVLCLHLKRFHGLQKMEDFVSFPACGLNMGAYLPHWCEDSGMGDTIGNDPTAPPPDAPYDLFATVNHFGSLHTGHYVSNVKIDNQWYHCNDAHVSFTTESQVLQGNAYLLFYVRSDVEH